MKTIQTLSLIGLFYVSLSAQAAPQFESESCKQLVRSTFNQVANNLSKASMELTFLANNPHNNLKPEVALTFKEMSKEINSHLRNGSYLKRGFIAHMQNSDNLDNQFKICQSKPLFSQKSTLLSRKLLPLVERLEQITKDYGTALSTIKSVSGYSQLHAPELAAESSLYFLQQGIQQIKTMSAYYGQKPNQCIVKNGFMFGASISAGYASKMDPMKGKGSGKTSLQFLIESTGSEYSFDNTNTMIRGGWYFGDTQEMFANHEINKQMLESSLIMTLDAFYWDSIDGEAHFDLENRACPQSLKSLEKTIGFAKTYQIPLFLGNIPEEDGSTVPYLVKKISNWREPYDNCQSTFNRQLEKACLPENQCFVIDIKKIVNQLNSDDGILWNGDTYYRSDFRLKDGLHLTALGSEYIAEQIAKKLNQHWPEALTCSE